MSASYVCNSCRQAIRSSLRQRIQRSSDPLQQSIPRARRPLSIASRARAAQPQAYQKSEPERTSEVPSPPPAPTSSPFSPVKSVAKQLRKRASVTTETYIAYGICEKLINECVLQADYRIPQAQDKNTNIPKTKDGEDLGIGEGWWYECKCTECVPLASLLIGIPSPRSYPNVQYLGTGDISPHVYAHLPTSHVPSRLRSNMASASA